MTIIVPDLDMITWLWHENPERRFNHLGATSLLFQIYGGQFDKGQLHMNGFNEDRLTADLEALGMTIKSARVEMGLTIDMIPELEVVCIKL
jgi:hypothetical protein